VVTASGRTVQDSVALALCWLVSVTVTLNVKVPVVVGLPARRPFAVSARPGGIWPEATDHV
jgi:hypothetical protein